MSALGATTKSGLGDPALAEPVVIRASQINHCAFCLDMHLALARGHGVPRRQLDPPAACEEAEGVFDERERAALALTEEVTVLTGRTSHAFGSWGGFVPDAVYEQAAEYVDDIRLAHLVGLIVAINNRNRVMAARRVPPGGHIP